jgi:hypothetical protein
MHLTASNIANYASVQTHLHDEVSRSIVLRDLGKRKFYQRWKDACNASQRSESPLDKFWSSEFKLSVKSGNRESINELITYLEVDPYYFRSGYLKGRLVRYLKNCPRTEEDNRRLRGIIWNRTGGPSRAEFREYCRLATLVSTPSFRADVVRKSKTFSSNSFKFLLPYLPIV